VTGLLAFGTGAQQKAIREIEEASATGLTVYGYGTRKAQLPGL
jgi:hypothetical protein